MSRVRSAFVACVFALLGFTGLLRADGLIVIHNPPGRVPGHFAFAPLEVTYHNVNVSIDNGVAVTEVDQEFYNRNPQRLEGTYIFPLPEGATIDKFAMDVDGKMTEAELLSADRAREVYEDIVRRQRDPALLEYAGRGAFKVRIFPIEPNSPKHVRLKYTQLIKPDNGVSEYLYPLNTEKFSARPLSRVAVKVDLKTSTPIKNVYCPSHTVEVRHDGAKRAVVGFEDRNVRPDTDFKLIWSQDKDPVGLSVLSWQTGSADGYFLLLASPGMDVDPKKVQPRDICFVLDTSGSMAGAKMEQARKALLFCLNNLNTQDRFEVIRFSTEAESLFDGLRPASSENVSKAEAFVKDLKAIGGTAIYDALQKAGKLFPNEDRSDRAGRSNARPGAIIFLTDGQPTIGQTNEDAIVASVSRRAVPLRIFSFGIGTDVNTHLLDRIANKTNAFSQYVLPEEDIEVKVSSFYTKIKEPVLSNVEVTFTGVKASQTYPHDLPDLFKGETLTVFGRYSGSGPGAVRITGMLNGERKEFVTDATFVKEDVKNAFIPRLWATRRVGWLLDEIRLRGESAELKDEIVRLAREHGIVTPYTSYLILEDERRRGVPISLQTMRELSEDRLASAAVRETYDSARKDSGQVERAGRRAVENSSNTQSLKQAEQLQQGQQNYAMAKRAAPPQGGGFGGGGGGRGGGGFGAAGSVSSPAANQPAGYKATQNYAQQSRVIKGRAFYQNGNVWTDAQAQNAQNLKPITIVFNSDPYFDLLKKHPEATPWLSLGDEVDVVLDNTLYSIRNAPGTTP